MKILHTSDWHLGKWLDTVSRIEEQRSVIAEISQIADQYSVDAVVVAGDVFDTYNPSIEAIELLYAGLKKLSNNARRPVVVIAGNHDSPERLEAPDPLARINGIIFMGFPHTKVPVFSIENGFSLVKSDRGFIELQLESGELLRIVSGAFANELRLKSYFDGQTEGDVLASFWKNIADLYCDTKGVNLLVGHLLMFSDEHPLAKEIDDERSIEHISAKIQQSFIPEQINYVALGHLHRYQVIKSSPEQSIVYSGSPIAYSFSEAGQRKKVVVVEYADNKLVNLTPVPLESGKLLIRKTCESVDHALEWLLLHPDALIELTIKSDGFLDAQIIRQLRAVHAGIVSIIPVIKTSADED